MVQLRPFWIAQFRLYLLRFASATGHTRNFPLGNFFYTARYIILCFKRCLKTLKFIHRLTISTLGKISMRVLFLMEQKPAVLGIQYFPLRKADENKVVHKMKGTKKNYDNRAFDGELNVLGIKHPFS